LVKDFGTETNLVDGAQSYIEVNSPADHCNFGLDTFLTKETRPMPGINSKFRHSKKLF
jgi:hypothetical protein